MLLVGRKRRPKTQNHLQISRNGYLDLRYVRNCTTISSIIQNCDQGPRFLHNPPVCRKRKPHQNHLETHGNCFQRLLDTKGV